MAKSSKIFTKATPYKEAGKKNKNKHRDKYRWWNFAAWVLPFITVPVVLTIQTDSIRGVWVSVFAWCVFLCYAVLMFERHVRHATDKTLRVGCVFLCACIVGLGFVWQGRIRSIMSIEDRPYVSLIEAGIADLEIGKTPTIVTTFKNSGKTPALNTVFYACAQPRGRDLPERPDPCKTAIPLENQPSPSSVFMPADGLYKMTLRLKGIVNSRDVELIGTGISVLYTWGTVDFEDSKGGKYTFTYCAKYEPQTNAFVACPWANSLTLKSA